MEEDLRRRRQHQSSPWYRQLHRQMSLVKLDEEAEVKMRSLIAITALALSALVLGGCSVAPSVAVHSLDVARPSVVSTDASARGIILLPKAGGQGMYVCAEPSPDVAMAAVAKMIAEVKTQNPAIDVKTQLEFQTAVVQLAQRSQTLQLLREGMYRACEAGINQNLSADQVMKLHELAMQAALKLAESELTRNKADLVKSLRDPKVRELFEQMTEPK